MAEDTETPTPESAETPKADGDKTATGVKIGSPLSRPTDAVARPGFRNPPNANSKAQKRKK